MGLLVVILSIYKFESNNYKFYTESPMSNHTMVEQDQAMNFDDYSAKNESWMYQKVWSYFLEGSEDSCELMGEYGVILQMLLFLFSFSTLLSKNSSPSLTLSSKEEPGKAKEDLDNLLP